MMSENSDTVRYGIVLVTAGSQEEANAIAHALVQARLAACVNITPIHSIYTWQNTVHQDEEWQLIIKTDLAQFAGLETKVREIHSYEVPEIIALPLVQVLNPILIGFLSKLIQTEVTYFQ